jgi:lipopolysaccharide export LptBFGC system permease protein LptF
MRRKKNKQKNQPQMSLVVQHMMRMASNMSVIFLVLSAIGLFYLSPDESERGIYYFVIVLNLVVFVGATVVSGFLSRSDKAFKKATDEKQGRAGKPTIGDWLDKQDKK